MTVSRKGTLPSADATISHKVAVLMNDSEMIDDKARHVKRLLHATGAVVANQ